MGQDQLADLSHYGGGAIAVQNLNHFIENLITIGELGPKTDRVQ
jgi:hypothetical protein